MRTVQVNKKITQDDMFAPIVTGIIELSEAMRKIDQSKLEQRVILLLLRDQTNMSLADIQTVLTACKNLSKKYIK